TRVTAGEVTSPCTLEVRKHFASNAPANHGARGFGVGCLRAQGKSEPIVSALCGIHQHVRWPAVLSENHIRVAIIVQIADRQSTAGVFLGECVTGQSAYVLHFCSSRVVHQQNGLSISDSAIASSHGIIRVPWLIPVLRLTSSNISCPMLRYKDVVCVSILPTTKS